MDNIKNTNAANWPYRKIRQLKHSTNRSLTHEHEQGFLSTIKKLYEAIIEA